MIRTILASTAMVALTAGAATADSFVYGGPYVATAPAPVIVERHAAVIPTAPVVIEPAPRVVAVPEVDRISPGAPMGSDPSGEKMTAGEAYRNGLDTGTIFF